MEFKRINNDLNGNPRFVFHFLAFLGNEEGYILDRYKIAVKKAKKIGGKAYRGKDFGGGIVLQSYNIEETIKRINRLAEEL
jgi:hypothetical protein